MELAPFPAFSTPRAITSGPHDHFYADYFGINAWSPDGRFALVLETDIKDRLPDGAPCTLGLVDLEDGDQFIPVTTTRCWNFQEAAMAHWLPGEKDTFVFNDVRGGKFCGVSYVVFPQVEPVVRKPFPHNRERMSRLARFSDLFNAVSHSATSYDYIDGISAEQLESWSSIWDGKPRLLHETCIDGTYADLSLEGMYADDNPIKKTKLFSEVRRVLTEKGIV